MVKEYKRKLYHETCIKTRELNIRNLNSRLKDFNTFANSIGLQIDELKLSQGTGSFVLSKKDIYDIVPDTDKQVYRALQAKDYCNLSEKKFKLFRDTLYLKKIIPPIHKVINKKKEINGCFDIKENNYGFYVDPVKKMESVIKDFYAKYQFDKKNKQIDKFMLKFAFDGTNITKTKMKNLNLTFTIINETDYAMSSKGNYIIGF